MKKLLIVTFTLTLTLCYLTVNAFSNNPAPIILDGVEYFLEGWSETVSQTTYSHSEQVIQKKSITLSLANEEMTKTFELGEGFFSNIIVREGSTTFSGGNYNLKIIFSDNQELYDLSRKIEKIQKE